VFVDFTKKKKEKKKCSFSEYTQQNRIIIVKKKPCLNDRDENPLKPLDKDRDTILPRLEEQSSSRPGQ